MRETIEKCVCKALLGEVYTTPKPGLVDLKDNGAHKDMDVHTFEKSTAAIAPYIAEMFCEGYANQQSLENLFARIRQIGIEAEKAMFEATKGINTHKGILFTMGIISGAAGYYYRKQHHFCVEEVLTLGGAMCQKALQNDFEKIINKIQASKSLIDIPLTHGEKMYLRYGIRGARGAAQDGFPILADYLWPLFGKYKKERKSGHTLNLQILLWAITLSEDTNVLKRGGIEGGVWLKKAAQNILEEGGAFTQKGISEIKRLNTECIQKNISPGGAADLLAATLYLEELSFNLNEVQHSIEPDSRQFEDEDWKLEVYRWCWRL